MYNVEDENGNIGNHLKIIRDDIGGYSWDSSPKSINEGGGVNEWSTSSIEKVLNENYYKKEAGGICYAGSEETVKKCPDWEKIGINDEARSMITKIKWPTGASNTGTYYTYLDKLYKAERTNENDKKNGCTKDSYVSGVGGYNKFYYCTDEVERKYDWTGYVGLMYPTDYGYATFRTSDNCIEKGIYDGSVDKKWTEGGTCNTNDWLFDNIISQWTITAGSDNTKKYASQVGFVGDNGGVGYGIARYINAIRPVVYLNSDVKIEYNEDPTYGTITNPYKLTT